jgi:hypothetical protein
MCNVCEVDEVWPEVAAQTDSGDDLEDGGWHVRQFASRRLQPDRERRAVMGLTFHRDEAAQLVHDLLAHVGFEVKPC